MKMKKFILSRPGDRTINDYVLPHFENDLHQMFAALNNTPPVKGVFQIKFRFSLSCKENDVNPIKDAPVEIIDLRKALKDRSKN